MSELNLIIHQPARLRIMSTLIALENGDKVDFTFLRDRLRMTDGNIGAHILKLEEAGYLAVEKTFVGRKPRTFVEATLAGRAAFQEHVKALEAIVSQTDK